MTSREARILDIGPGSGALAAVLRSRGYEQLFGVEIDPTARDFVAPLFVQIEPSLAPFEGAIAGGVPKFDVVLLMDVLEHMTNPFEYFATVVKLLAPGGVLFISVPNVAHWSIRLSLLCGVFRYTERGLLDRTHYHLFTRSHLQELINSAPALTTVERSSSIVPLEFLLPKIITAPGPLGLPFRFFAKIRQGIAALLPGLAAFQHLAVAKKGASREEGPAV